MNVCKREFRQSVFLADSSRTFHRARDFFFAVAASRGAVAAGFFFPSMSARLCFSADIRSTTGASFFGFSTSAIVPPSSLVWIRFLRLS